MIQRFQSCLLAVLLFISSQLIAQQISNLGSYDGIDNGAVPALLPKTVWAICGLVLQWVLADFLVIHLNHINFRNIMKE